MSTIEYIIFYICLAAAFVFAVLLFTYPLRLRRQRKAKEEERKKTTEEEIDELLRRREEIKEILKKKGIIQDDDNLNIDSFWMLSETGRIRDEMRAGFEGMRSEIRETRSLILFSTGLIIATIIAFGIAIFAAVT